MLLDIDFICENNSEISKNDIYAVISALNKSIDGLCSVHDFLMNVMFNGCMGNDYNESIKMLGITAKEWVEKLKVMRALTFGGFIENYDHICKDMEWKIDYENSHPKGNIVSTLQDDLPL